MNGVDFEAERIKQARLDDARETRSEFVLAASLVLGPMALAAALLWWVLA